MRRGAAWAAALLFTSVVMTAPAAARQQGGASAGEFLRLTTGAREAATGDAATAAAGGVAALHYNPANLAWTERGEAGAMYQNLTLDINQGALGFAAPWGDEAGWGVGLSYLDYGNAMRTTLSTVGGAAVGATAGTFGVGHDAALGISYGRRLGRYWAWGATARGVASDLDDVTASGFAVDLGISWRPEGRPWRLGAAVRNLGTNLRYERVSEEIPLLIRFGGALSLLEDRIVLHADLEAARTESVTGMAGGEFWLNDSINVRAGWNGRVETEHGFTVGMGFRHEDLALDYAYTPFGNLGDSHRVGLRYLFGPER